MSHAEAIKEVNLFHSNQIFSRHDAEDAIDGLDGRKYDGRELSVQYARLEFSDTMVNGHMCGSRQFALICLR